MQSPVACCCLSLEEGSGESVMIWTDDSIDSEMVALESNIKFSGFETSLAFIYL